MSGRGSPPFAPGDIVARRFRIKALVGSGGMGSVYRVQDTTLGRVVALKVPPADKGGDGEWWGVVRNEVQQAQKVSHQNVCRVHDVILDGEPLMPLLSMQFIEGETLRTYLDRPVGSLSADDKVRIAQEICAGLEAIHNEGVVHRDLKPANIMIDRQGRTLITDFGLSTDARAILNPRGGTWLYMAPEQRAGEGVSKQSDLYALGVVLFELFTGRHPFQRHRGEELKPEDLEERLGEPLELSQQEESALCGPLAEKIFQCLDPDSEERPKSIKEVVGAIPDDKVPLPPYRLLVQPQGGLRREAAWACLAGTVLGLFLASLLGLRSQIAQRAVLGDSPAVLEARAHDLLVDLGIEEEAKAERSGYGYDPSQIDRLVAGVAGFSPVTFWYRRSPERLVAVREGSPFHDPEDPPLAIPGEVRVVVDPQGRLLALDAVPVAEGDGSSPSQPDWRPLFRAADLHPDEFRPVAPRWIPPRFAHRRVAWEERGGSASAEPLRVEAASTGGRPVGFRVFGRGSPVPRGGKAVEGALRSGSRAGRVVSTLWIAAVVLGALLFARRNWRLKRADLPAAARLALFVFAVRLLVGLFGAGQIPGPTDLPLALAVSARASFVAALVWLIYVALEPLARRFFPTRAASWVRLVYGRCRDPLVGRDLLIGGLFGLGAILWARLYALGTEWSGLPAPRPDRLGPLMWMIGQEDLALHCEALGSLRRSLAMASYALVHGVLVAFFWVVGVMLLRRVLEEVLRFCAGKEDSETEGDGEPVSEGDRERCAPDRLDRRWWWLSRGVAFCLLTVVTFPAAGHPLLDLVAAAGAGLLWLVALVRFGFLAALTATVFTWLLNSHPATLDPAAWSASGYAVPLILTLAIALWGFRVSILADHSGDRAPVPGRFFD